MCTPQIIDYKIITSFNQKGLEESVQKAISDGYEPFGNMVITNGNCNQPVVLYSRPEPKAQPPLLEDILFTQLLGQKPD